MPAFDKKPELIPYVTLTLIAGEIGLSYSQELERFARRIEYEAHAIQPKLPAGTEYPHPLAQHELDFITNVRTVVAGIRESILQEERERIARAIPQWLRKGAP